MDNLLDRIKAITGRKRTFILMRVSGLDADLSMNLVGVAKGTYNSWFKNEEFATVYHQLPELIQNYRQEAVQLLRRNNQLEAVLLESKIISKLKEEIESGHYELSKTHLAREVYSKLMSDLDTVPQNVKVLSWSQRVQQIFTKQPDQIEQGEIDGKFKEISSESLQHSEGDLITSGEQTTDETTKVTEEAGV